MMGGDPTTSARLVNFATTNSELDALCGRDLTLVVSIASSSPQIFESPTAMHDVNVSCE